MIGNLSDIELSCVIVVIITVLVVVFYLYKDKEFMTDLTSLGGKDGVLHALTNPNVLRQVTVESGLAVPDASIPYLQAGMIAGVEQNMHSATAGTPYMSTHDSQRQVPAVMSHATRVNHVSDTLGHAMAETWA